MDTVLATGRPLVESVTINRPSVFSWLWPFAAYPEPREISVRRAGRDHTLRPLLYFTFPGATLGGHPAVAVCVSECPSPPRLPRAEDGSSIGSSIGGGGSSNGSSSSSNSSSDGGKVHGNATISSATGNATTGVVPQVDSAQYVCNGQHYGTHDDRCRHGASADVSSSSSSGVGGGGRSNATSRGNGSAVGSSAVHSPSANASTVRARDFDAEAACESPPASLLFSTVGREQLSACDDPMGACDVCYPPYRTVPFASYCLPDPQHALETFSTVVTAFGAIGASLDGRMTIQELDEMRRFVSSAPHILWEDLVASAPVVFGCIGAAFVYGLVWMVLIRLFAHLMVWVTVLSISAGCGIGAYYMWLTQASMKATARYGSADRLYTQQADYLYAGFFAVAGIGAAYTVAIVLLHRKLILAVKVMKEASRAVTGVPSTLLLPVITLSISVALLAGYGVVAVLLLSTGELEPTTPGFGHIFLPVDTCSWLALLTFACM